MSSHPMPIVPVLAPGQTPQTIHVAAPPVAGPIANLVYHGGYLLTTTEVFTIFWGAAWQQPAQSRLAGDLNGFFDFMLRSSLMDQMGEYSVPGQTIFQGRRIGTITVADSEPGSSGQVSDDQIRSALQSWIQAGRIPPATGNRLYFVYLPPGVTSTAEFGSSCSQFCGYHFSSGSIFYAVMPFVTCVGCTFGTSQLDTLTKISSHELCEAVTDPQATFAPTDSGWWDPTPGTGEIGDICNGSVQRLGPYLIQAEWSNRIGNCAVPAANQQHIFYRAGDGSVRHIFWDAPNNRLFTDDWSGKAGAPAAAGDTVTMMWPVQQHVFYRARDGSVRHIFYDGPTNRLFTDDWSGRTHAPAADGDPATLVWPTQQHLFYRARDGSVRHIFWDSPTNQLFTDDWSGRTHAPAAAGDPATMVWPNQQHIFYRARDGSVRHIFWDGPTNQLITDDWSGKAGAPAAAGDPATMVWPSQQHVFYRAGDGAIHHIFWDAPTNRLFTDNWTARTGAPAAAGDPVTMAWPTQQHIFYRAADGSIQHIFWDAPTNRLFTDDWTGRAHAPAAVGHPMTMVWPNQQHLFYRARDGSVHHIFWDAPTNQLFTDNWSGNTGAPAADGNPDTLKIFATN